MNPLSKAAKTSSDDLKLREKVPDQPERNAVGAPTSKIKRGTPEFKALTKNVNADIVFKDEEPGEADHYMTRSLSAKADALAVLVKSEWPGKKMRVTEAWDEQDEHGTQSTHYEARGIDITVSDKDRSKLGRLGRLAVKAGFEWVYYEDVYHIHASMSK